MASLRDRRGRQDTYYRKAKTQGYAARSIYKLEELDRRFRLLRPGQRVLDLGCCPGSWLQYACSRIGPGGHVVGVDREAPAGDFGAQVSILVGDVRLIEPGQMLAALPAARRGCFHLVLSDMAPDTTGIACTDHARSIELFLRALDLSVELGCPGGDFVGKVFMGEGFAEALARVKQSYARARTVRPDATRKASSEVYVVATSRRRSRPEQ